MASGKPNRLYELDSLRGLAALTVVFCHFLDAARPDLGVSVLSARVSSAMSLDLWAGWWLLDTFTPVHLFVAGHEAVILFFLLSGFVLSLPFEKKPAPAYRQYLVKRICRIYLPYLGALALAVALNLTVSAGGLPALGAWFNQTWKLPVRKSDVLCHVLFLGDYDYARFNTAFWSLVYELRISLFFPAIIIVARRKRFVWLFMASLSALYIILASYEPAWRKWAITLQYTTIFCLGSVIAQNRYLIEHRFRAAKYRDKVLFGISGLVLYAYSLRVGFRYFPLVSELPVALGASVLIIIAFASSRTRSVLTGRLLRTIGTLSYSLYLVHGTCLFTVIYLLYHRCGWACMFVLYLIMSLACAVLFHQAIEAPCTRLGHNLAGRVSDLQRFVAHKYGPAAGLR